MERPENPMLALVRTFPTHWPAPVDVALERGISPVAETILAGPGRAGRP